MADDYGMYLGGGYGYLPYINDAYRLGMEGEQQNITRYGQYGTVPVVVNPDFDYFTTIQKAVDEYKARNPNYPRDERGLMRKDVWSQIAASVTDLSPEVWQKQYDISSGILSRQGRMQTPEEFNSAIGQAANMGMPSLASKLQDANLTGYTTDAQGNRTPTLARQKYQTDTGIQTAQVLASLRGPENYFQYANALRGLQGSPMLEYAQQLGQPGGSAGFNAWGQSQPATLQGLVGGRQPGAQPGIPAPAAQAPGATPQIPAPGTGQRGIDLTMLPQGQQAPDFDYSGGGFTWKDANGQIHTSTSGTPTTPPTNASGWGGVGQYPGTTPAVLPSQNGAANPASYATEDQARAAYQAAVATNPGGRLQPPGGQQPWNEANQIYKFTDAQLAAMQPRSDMPGQQARGITFEQAAGTIPAPAGQLPAFVQPHQANVRQLSNWSPTEQKMWNSGLEARGYQPDDWWAAQKRAAPKGSAAGSTTWR